MTKTKLGLITDHDRWEDDPRTKSSPSGEHERAVIRDIGAGGKRGMLDAQQCASSHH